MTIIAVAGKMGSGKDTAVEHLVRNYGFKRMAFADNLKYACMNVFGLSYEQCFDEAEKFKPFTEWQPGFFWGGKDVAKPISFTGKHAEGLIHWAHGVNKFDVTSEMKIAIYNMIGKVTFETPRHILQYVGTEILRNIIDEDYHAKVLYQDIQASGAKNIAISDCRFPNERQKIREWGGSLILVTGRETDKPADEKSKSHASENSFGVVGDYDFAIANVATLEVFYTNVDWIMVNQFKMTKSTNVA